MNKKDQHKSKKCMHDYKNAVQVGKVDYVCPLCKELLDPMEWFFTNSFKFVDVKAEKYKSDKLFKKGGRIAGDARKKLEKETGKKISTNKNFLLSEKKIIGISLRKD